MRGRKLTALLTSVAATALLLVPAAAPASAVPCSGGEGGTRHGLETVTLRTFHIDAKPRKKSYKIGETVVFDVTVTRPAEEDPFGAGVPMDAVDPEPAAEVPIGSGLLVGDVFFSGFAITNEKGKATIKAKIEKYAKPAKSVDVAFYAWKTQADTPCLRVEENGFRAYPGMITVR